MLLILEGRDLASGVIDRVKAQLGSLSGTQKVLAAGLAAAAVGGTAAAYELAKFADHSVRAAASFQQANTLMVTQAGVAQSRIAGMAQQMLEWAPKLAQTPQALSEAWYHVASAGIPVAQQFATVKAAAEGAAIGNADFEQTTNSLVAALRSGIGGIRGARDAMAALMAIVGTGNMKLDDLNAAMGTGLPSVAKTFGVSLQSAGAALAYFTDTGMKAAPAASRLTMLMALLGGPTQQSSKVLGALGLTTDQIHSKFAVVSQALEKAHVSFSQLALDMRRPDGLVVAFQDLKTRMEQAGLSAPVQAAVISRAFGGGHMGKAAMAIYEALPKVAQKFGQINASVASFGQHWQETTKTAVFQANSMHAAFSSISTAIGSALLPAVQKLAAALIPVITRVAEFVAKHKTLSAIILAAALGFAVLTAAVATLSLAFLALDGAAAPWIALALAIVTALVLIGVGIYELQKHWHTVWADIKKTLRETWDDIRSYLGEIWNRIVAMGEEIWRDFKGWLGTLWGDIRGELFTAWGDVRTFFANLWGGIRSDLVKAWTAIKGWLDGLFGDEERGWQRIWGWIKDFGKWLWGKFKEGLEAGWQDVEKWFEGLPGRILGALERLGDLLLDLGKRLIDGLWNGIKTAWGDVKGWFGRVGDEIKGWLRGAGTWLLGIGHDIIAGLWKGLKLAWETVKGWFGTLGSLVKGWLRGAGKWLLKIGGDAITGLWTGMKDVWKIVRGWLLSLGSLVAGAVVGAAKWLYQHGRQALTGLWDGMKDLWKTVKGWLGDLKMLVVGLFKDAGRWLVNAGRAVIDGLWDGMKSVFASLEGWFESKLSSLKDMAESVLHIGSPSQVFVDIGHNVMKGLQIGLSDGSLAALQQMRVTATSLVTAGREGTAVPIAAPLGGSSSGPVTFELNFNGPGVWKPSDIDGLVNQIGNRLATYLLPGAGMQVRRRT